MEYVSSMAWADKGRRENRMNFISISQDTEDGGTVLDDEHPAGNPCLFYSACMALAPVTALWIIRY